MLTFGAGNAVRISRVTCAAGAVAAVVSGAAISILSAVTRIFAFLITARQVVGAIIVHQAFIRFAVNKRIALVVLGTIALGTVVAGPAEGVDPAVLKEARVLAFSADARLVIRTLVISFAAS